MSEVFPEPDLEVGIVGYCEAEVIPGPETLARQAAERELAEQQEE